MPSQGADDILVTLGDETRTIVCPSGWSGSSFVRWVQERLEKTGYKAKGYSGHSFQATAAATAGIQDSVIKAMGKWESTAYLIYVRIPPVRTSGGSSPIGGLTRDMVICYVVYLFSEYMGGGSSLKVGVEHL